MKIAYQDINFSADRLALVEQCNEIIDEYQADNLQLTLRQLYYQLVARAIIPNRVQEYKRLGDIVNNGRLAGLIDWDAIEDRTRALEALSHWNSPAEIVAACAAQFRLDKWAEQDTHVEVWIEKEALAGVFERVCQPLDVAYFACRGYTSQSEMWGAAMRFVNQIKLGKRVIVFHFGDHDPSGIDMTRDIEERLVMFASSHVGSKAGRISIRRLALNMDQVEEYSPPENPAKTTDSRFASYQREFGESSWELDALNPRVLADLVRNAVLSVRDEETWDSVEHLEAGHRNRLQLIAERWNAVTDFLEGGVAS